MSPNTHCQCHNIKKTTKTECPYEMTQEDLLCDWCRKFGCMDLTAFTAGEHVHSWYGHFDKDDTLPQVRRWAKG